MTDFFERQERALRRSRLLSFLSLLLWLLVVLVVELVVGYFYAIFWVNGWSFSWWFSWLITPPALGIAGGLLLVMTAGAVWKGGLFSRHLPFQLQRELGAHEIDYATTDSLQRVLVNVVEEMSIASGVALPRLFLLQNEGRINAFVAGRRSDETTLTVTDGALQQLTRDELQAVVAHEFSHLLHSDALLNTRLYSIVAGLLGLSSFGARCARLSVYDGKSRSRSSVNPFAAFVSVFLLLVGACGAFAAQILKAAVSRQREHLADASALQFTRNREGLAGALQKISATPPRFQFSGSIQADISYMCITPMVTNIWGSLLATHPPIQKRIELLQLVPVVPPVKRQSDGGRATRESVLSSVGELTGTSLAAAEGLLQSMGAGIRESLHHPQKVVAVMMGQALLQDRSGVALQKLRELDSSLALKTEPLLHELEQLGEEGRLPLLDLMMPALRKVPNEELMQRLQQLQQLVVCDKKVSSFELALIVVVQRRLTPLPEQPSRRIKELAREVSLVLQLMMSGSKQPLPPDGSVQKQLSQTVGVELLWDKGESVDHYIRALLQMGELQSSDKKRLLKAATLLVLHDGEVRATERHLLRALGSAMEIPIPLLFS